MAVDCDSACFCKKVVFQNGFYFKRASLAQDCFCHKELSSTMWGGSLQGGGQVKNLGSVPQVRADRRQSNGARIPRDAHCRAEPARRKVATGFQ
eukprot:1337764-Amphidinium_carterae.1